MQFRIGVMFSVTTMLLSVTGDCLAKSPVDYDTLEQSRHKVSHSASHRYNSNAWRWGGHWNNRWGSSVGISWGNGFYDPWRRYRPWYGPYRHRYYRDDYHYRQPRIEPKVTPVQSAPVTRSTTSLTVDEGLRSLPANARVVQRDGQTYYQWQGNTYRFDWIQNKYLIVND
ncbi:hypothetical protein [Shewanella maritima]|uniref:hypothetical protein n=1 Tax=Shewanella maritima TaxID=2520507 RepID=UPI003736CA84